MSDTEGFSCTQNPGELYSPVPIEVTKRHERIEDLVYEHHSSPSPLLFCG